MHIRKSKGIETRPPVALIGSGDRVVYFQGEGVVYRLSSEGHLDKVGHKTLSEMVTPNRTPVYEGETLEVTF